MLDSVAYQPSMARLYRKRIAPTSEQRALHRGLFDARR